ncbi:MAG: GGDEF domain-containing protein [Deinococcota bacterium]|nr:GGDEF domain-containing protein [Deinococcota bacterium]
MDTSASERRRSLHAAKRAIYLSTTLTGIIAIPAVLVTNTLRGAGAVSFGAFVLLLLVAVLGTLLYLLWRRVLPVDVFERLKLNLLSLFFLAEFAYSFLLAGPLTAAPGTTLWAPLLWIMNALAYPPRRAFVRSALLLGGSALTVVLSVLLRPDAHLWTGDLSAGLVLFYPLSATMIGILFVFSSVQYAYTGLERFAEEMAQSADTDALTGAPNRRYLEKALAQGLYSAEVHGTPLSLILFDTDQFKQVNDAYGHAVGDEVLKQFVRIARRHLRKADRLGRWGGEEFVILASDTGDEALALAERLHLAVQDSHFRGVDRPITISLGVATFRPGDTAETLLERADKALHEAKEAGRNRVNRETRLRPWR